MLLRNNSVLEKTKFSSIRSRMSKKNLFALLSQCLVKYYEKLAKTKILTKISNFLHFLKI